MAVSSMPRAGPRRDRPEAVLGVCLYGAGGVFYRFGAVTPNPQPGEIARERLALAISSERCNDPALREIDERVAVAGSDTRA